MIDTRKYVPDYYEKSRDYQVFLKMLDIILNACYADTEYFTSLLSPNHCKARMLPFLSHYVGYTYDYQESVKMNRALTKNWPTLKRNRGSLTGMRMAVALAMSQLEDLDSADIYKLFNVTLETISDEFGREYNKFKIYLYHQTYLSKLHDLIEAVRPAGTEVDIIPAVPIYSNETVVLTDEFRMLGYDYTTGKLIWIGDIPIYVENCWEVMQGTNSTGEYLVDNAFYDAYHNPLNLELDSKQRIIDTNTGKYTGELVRAPRIYTEYVIIQNSNNTSETLEIKASELNSYENNGWVMLSTSRLEDTGKYFNVEHSARVLNTCYEIRCGGKSTGYFVSADNWTITDETKSRIQFYLKDYMLNGVLVKKVYGKENDTKYNWHVDSETGYFVKDNEGTDVNTYADNIPWDEHCYISKKRFVMNTSASGVMYTTNYFVNKYEDIQDGAGNIVLSKKDRYKVSDSSHVGFSEVHNLTRPTTYDKTWTNARSKGYRDDKDYFNTYMVEDFNDYNTDSGYVDTRIKIKPTDIRVYSLNESGIEVQPQREYDGTTRLCEISASSVDLHEIEGNKAIIHIQKAIDTPNEYSYPIYVELKVNLKSGDDFSKVFSKIQLTYDNENVGTNKHLHLDWKLAENAEQFYNVYELPERIVISNCATITPKTIRFDYNEEFEDSAEYYINLTGKVYDGTVQVPSDSVIIESVTGGDL